MTEPTFKRPELEDKEIISSYFEKAQSRSCERTFVNVYLWSRHYKVQYAIIEDTLVFPIPDRRVLNEADGMLFLYFEAETSPSGCKLQFPWDNE